LEGEIVRFNPAIKAGAVLDDDLAGEMLKRGIPW